MNFAIGVDLGGTNLRVAAVTADGELLEKVTTGTKVSLGRDAVIDEMTNTIRELAQKSRKAGAMLGIGIGVPGIIDERTGMLRESPNLPGWKDYPVKEAIERRLGARVILENDANAAAVGEAWLGAARTAKHMCMLTLGTGVGGGLVLNGRAWHGMIGMAGELGHIMIEPNGPKCGCGSHGCVEQFASATAIVRMAHEAIQTGLAPQLARALADQEFSAEVIHNLAVQGDKPAQQVFEKVGWALGIVLAGLINALNLDMYVLGGGVSRAWSVFAPAMFAEIRRRSFVYAATAPDDIAAAITEGAASTVKPLGSSPRTLITRALLGSDAGLYGAARLPMLGTETDS
jgi:glucokinase